MSSEKKDVGSNLPVIAYARFLVEMHNLIRDGKGDSPEAEAVADQMDEPWHALTRQEQARMRGLAADLNTLREGGPQRVDLDPEAHQHWQVVANQFYGPSDSWDVDEALNFLRQPTPTHLPPGTIPSLQARCWNKLGDVDTALVFMNELGRQVPKLGLQASGSQVQSGPQLSETKGASPIVFS